MEREFISLIKGIEPPEPFDYGDEVEWIDCGGKSRRGSIVGFHASDQTLNGRVDTVKCSAANRKLRTALTVRR